MFERMAEAEEEQKERPVGPCPGRRRACRCDQHQGIDLEPFDPKAVDRFAQRVVAAEEITQKVECQPSPTEIRAQLLETENGCKQRSGNHSKDELGIAPENEARSEERGLGEEGVGNWSCRGWPYH